MDEEETPSGKHGEKKSWFNSAASIVAVTASLFGLFVGYKKLIEEKPNLIVQVESIGLNGYVHPDTIIYKLEDIEQQYGLATGDRINLLKYKVRKLNNRFLDSAQVVDIISSIYDNIRFFQMPPPKPWDYTQIQYTDGVIIWPDGATYDTRKDDGARTVLGAATDSISLINLKRAAYSLYQPFDKEEREAIANRLRVVRTLLKRLADHPGHFLEVHLRVINKSTQPNMLMRTAHLSITQQTSERVKADLPMIFSNESVVGGMSEAHMVLRSSLASHLKPFVDLHEIFTSHKSLLTDLDFSDVQESLWKAQTQIEVNNGQAEVRN